MKLTGTVNGIDRRAADRVRGGKVKTEKRGFMIQLRPATPVDNYYSYGSMNFYLNGNDLDSFPVDLGDEVEVYLLRQGAADGEFALEDMERRALEAEAQVSRLTAANEQHTEKQKNHDRQQREMYEKLTAAAHVNAQLFAQVEALKLGRSDIVSSSPTLIEGRCHDQG